MSSTWRWALGQVVTSLLTLLFVIVFNFFLFRLLPGDAITSYTRGRQVDPEQLAALRRSLDLDGSRWEQFAAYMRNPFNPDVLSLKFRQPVFAVIGDRLWPTVLLVGTATVLASVLGIWIGIRGAWRPGSAFDRVSTTASVALYAMPEFWLGMLLLIVFSVGVGPLPGIFPSGQMTSLGADAGTWARADDLIAHLALPCLTLTLAYLAEYALVMRSSLLDERGADYLTTARAKGLRDALVRRRHAVPNALLPTITLIFLNLGFVISGAITVETVFSWPGLGQLTYEALSGPDVPLLEGLFLVFSITVVVANLAADLLYGLLDPRVRTS
ncbi:MAG: ABC transporter permease [Kineosporiaceae bacterium]